MRTTPTTSFSRWTRWADRQSLTGGELPGVYALAVTDSSLDGARYTLSPSIAYFGMTNALAGLRGRMNQFDRTIRGGRGHGGADRFRYQHSEYGTLREQLYVAIAPFRCDVARASARDLEIMGAVAQFEYTCLARYVRRFHRLPQFNDKRTAIKFSRMLQ